MAKATKSGKHLITKEGRDKLQKELHIKETIMRDEIANKLEIATEQGDLSENSAYKSALEERELNELRIEELKELLASTEVIQDEDATLAGLGDKITLKTGSGKTIKFTLVGKSEADPSNMMISIDSPLGKVVHGEKIGAKLVVNLPTGKQEYTLLKIEV